MKIRIINDINFPLLTGLEGEIEKPHKWHGINFYKIEATNFGSLMPTATGTKKVFAWRPGNIRNIPAKSTILTEEGKELVLT